MRNTDGLSFFFFFFFFELFLTRFSRPVSVKESEDKENLPKRTQTGSFKFTFSHSAAATSGNNDKPAPSASPASPNSSSTKGATVASTPVVKVGVALLALCTFIYIQDGTLRNPFSCLKKKKEREKETFADSLRVDLLYRRAS